MDLSQPTVYEPFAHTGYTVQEPEDEHPELATDEQRLIEKQNSRRHRAQAPSTSHFSALVRGVTLCIAITVLAIQSNWISLWYKTRNDIMANPQDHFKPKAWPAVLDIKPAYIMLAVAALSIVFQLLAILTHVSPVSAG
jgi:nitroreductase